jgi:hypothetical protein
MADDDRRPSDDLPEFLRELVREAQKAAEAAEPALRKLYDDVERAVENVLPDLAGKMRPAERPEPEDDAQDAPAPADAPATAPHAGLRSLRAWLDEHAPLVGAGAEDLRRHADVAHVGNWAELSDPEWHAMLAALRTDEDLPVAWVTPAHVLRAVLAAEDDGARDAALVAASDELAVAAASVLERVTLTELAGLRALLEDGWGALAAGVPRAAGATAAAALAELLDGPLEVDAAELRDGMAAIRSGDEAAWPLAAERMRAVWRPVSATADARRPRTAAANLRRLLTATAAARELQYVLGEEHRLR